jgi:hypothetical protein
MNGVEKAIKKAIEGGYNYRESIFGDGFNAPIQIPRDLMPFQDSILLDPLFWQALEKELPTNSVFKGNENYTDEHRDKLYKNMALKHWHNFIDHIAQGGNIDEFFNKLLTN